MIHVIVMRLIHTQIRHRITQEMEKHFSALFFLFVMEDKKTKKKKQNYSFYRWTVTKKAVCYLVYRGERRPELWLVFPQTDR